MVVMLVQKLHEDAKLPTVATPGEDLGYDLYALEDVLLPPGEVVAVRTGIAVEMKEQKPLVSIFEPLTKTMGALIRDRSSMAKKGITTSGGVIDAGYRGEIVVLMTKAAGKEDLIQDAAKAAARVLAYLMKCPAPTNSLGDDGSYMIRKGDKIAQLIPTPIYTGAVEQVTELGASVRGKNGFGSTGAR